MGEGVDEAEPEARPRADLSGRSIATQRRRSGGLRAGRSAIHRRADVRRQADIGVGRSSDVNLLCELQHEGRQQHRQLRVREAGTAHQHPSRGVRQSRHPAGIGLDSARRPVVIDGVQRLLRPRHLVDHDVARRRHVLQGELARLARVPDGVPRHAAQHLHEERPLPQRRLHRRGTADGGSEQRGGGHRSVRAAVRSRRSESRSVEGARQGPRFLRSGQLEGWPADDDARLARRSRAALRRAAQPAAAVQRRVGAAARLLVRPDRGCEERSTRDLREVSPAVDGHAQSRAVLRRQRRAGAAQHLRPELGWHLRDRDHYAAGGDVDLEPAVRPGSPSTELR